MARRSAAHHDRTAGDDIDLVELLPKVQVPHACAALPPPQVAQFGQGERDLPRGVGLSRKPAPAPPEARARRSTRRAQNPRARLNRYAAATRSASFLRA